MRSTQADGEERIPFENRADGAGMAIAYWIVLFAVGNNLEATVEFTLDIVH
ncbi:hypothetical protein [Gorillibacterium timonense]|uniref:hypothetical protein n=1 Tax=Gorillibacterium timonense TaxID=1689269 RepID=UPI00131AA0E3|nr:hypothetical protein [Gorillibacterium timonense]